MMFARLSKGKVFLSDRADTVILTASTNSSITWHLPRNVPFEAKKILIVQFVERWHRPSLSCFDAVFSDLSDFIEKLTIKHFGQFKQLERHIRYEPLTQNVRYVDHKHTFQAIYPYRN